MKKALQSKAKDKQRLILSQNDKFPFSIKKILKYLGQLDVFNKQYFLIIILKETFLLSSCCPENTLNNPQRVITSPEPLLLFLSHGFLFIMFIGIENFIECIFHTISHPPAPPTFFPLPTHPTSCPFSVLKKIRKNKTASKNYEL